MIEKNFDNLYEWTVSIFIDTKIKKNHGQMAHASLKGEWCYPTQDTAIKDAKKTLKSLEVRLTKKNV